MVGGTGMPGLETLEGVMCPPPTYAPAQADVCACMPAHDLCLTNIRQTCPPQ